LVGPLEQKVGHMKGYLLPVIVTCLFYTKMATFATVRQHHFDVNPIMEPGAGLGFTISKFQLNRTCFALPVDLRRSGFSNYGYVSYDITLFHAPYKSRGLALTFQQLEPQSIACTRPSSQLIAKETCTKSPSSWLPAGEFL